MILALLAVLGVDLIMTAVLLAGVLGRRQNRHSLASIRASEASRP